MSRRPWDLAFTAEPEAVAALRRIMRLHLTHWGLHEAIETAQICVSELVSNVIKHVGHGTPATLAVSMKGTHLRIEVHDPDTRALPTLTDSGMESETGRGIALIDGLADRWGVHIFPERKVTWCELATSLVTSNGHSGSPPVTRAEELLDVYGKEHLTSSGSRRLRAVASEEAAILVIADLLHWLRAHGRDADEVLDRAQMRFDAEVGGLGLCR